ncbi:MAG: Rid family detoxifying hydrolase [Oscillospiraceae bacterium]|nr:Rid family detoxifying hydrolase [Oscillospiraceae bacterium]
MFSKPHIDIVKKIIFTEDAPFPVGPYSQAMLVKPESGETLYASGQIAMKCIEAGENNVTKQTEEVCGNVKSVLKAAGMQIEDVVKTTCFLADMSDFAEFNAVYEKHFAHKPARSCVAAKQLPKNAMVEVEIIAII